MKLNPVIAALGVAAILGAAPVLAADPPIRFDGAIGSQPLRAGGASNVILNVSPGGVPWVIRTFRADINVASSGRTSEVRIVARGEGLLLGGTNTPGARGGVRFVAVSLFCPGDPDPFNSGAVPLDANGDFQINTLLTHVKDINKVPAPCGDNLDNRPVLLIRNSTATDASGNPVSGNPSSWFAAGILKD
jgi:hypothetical protein